MCTLEKLLAVTKVLINGPQIIPLPDRLSCSLDFKTWEFFSISQRAKALQSIKYIPMLSKWKKKALKSEDNCIHQANYPKALLANEISQEACPALINQRIMPMHLQ